MRAAIGQEGKTLVETMTIVSILGIAAMMTAEVLLPATRHNQAQAVRAELAGELRVARQLAMTRGHPVRVRLEAGRSRLTIESVQSGAVLRALDFTGRGVQIDRVSNGPDVLFYGSGRAATPATVTLRSVDDGRFYTLTVSITGRVTLK